MSTQIWIRDELYEAMSRMKEGTNLSFSDCIAIMRDYALKNKIKGVE